MFNRKLKKLLGFSVLALVFIFAQMPSAVAATLGAACVANQKTWDGGGSTNNWTEAANWTCDAVPISTDNVIFNGTSAKNAAVNVNVVAETFQINAGYTGAISLGLSNLTVAGGITQGAGTFNGGSAVIVCNGPFSMTGGTFNGGSSRLQTRSTFTVTSAATFNGGEGKVVFGVFSTINVDSLLVPNSLTFHDIQINTDGFAAVIETGDTLVSTGTVELVTGGIQGGTLEARGNVTVSPTFTQGLSSTGGILAITGAATRTVIIPAGVVMPGLTLNAANVTVDTSGTGTIRFKELVRIQNGIFNKGSVNFLLLSAFDPLIQSGGIFNGGSGTFTGCLALSGGIFNGGSAVIACTGPFSMTGGTFNGGSSRLQTSSTFTVSSAATFNGGEGKVVFGGFSTINVDSAVSNSLTFHDIQIDTGGTAANIVIETGDTLVSTGTVELVTGGFQGGTLEARGNVTVAPTFTQGSSSTGGILAITGAATRTVIIPAGVVMPGLTLNAANVTVDTSGTGTIRFKELVRLQGGIIDKGSVNFNLFSNGELSMIQSGGIFNGGSGTFTGCLTLSGGIFNGGSAVIACNGPFSMTGGTFNGGSSRLQTSSTFTVTSAAVFNAQAGKVVFGGSGGPVTVNPTLTPNALIFNNVQVDSGGFAFALQSDQKIIVAGLLELTTGGISSGTVEALGDVTLASSFTGGAGNGRFRFAGNANQTYTSPSGTPFPGLASMTVAKGPDSLVTVNGGLILSQSDFSGELEITSGTLYLNDNSRLTVKSISVGQSGKLVNESSTTITIGGNLINSGTIDLQGGGAGCPETDSILIRSNNATQRSWTGAGKYRLVDVDVQNMGGTGTKNVFSGTNSGGNNATWVFNAGCPAALVLTPSNVSVQTGGTQSFTAGGGFDPRTFSILTNNSGGSINATTGLYTAGTTAGVTDTIRVTDAFGATAAATVTVFGVPNKLAFSVQPTNAVAGQAISPAVKVTVQDSFGNTVTNSNAAITLSIQNNPSDGTLAGTLIKNAVNGIATFDNLSVNRASNGYTLRAVSGSLTAATSSTFNVTVGAASRLAFNVQPSNTDAGAVVTPAVQVVVQDANGNTVTTANDAITIAIGNNPAAGTLLGLLTRNAINGFTLFNDIRIANPGNGYTLIASSGSLTPATSAAFNIINPFVVTNTNDSGAGSLRQAIIAANAVTGTQTISFNIAGIAPFSIAPASALPFITDSVVIDGTTQPGFAGSPIIELNGANTNGGDGFAINANNCEIKGFSVNRFFILSTRTGNGMSISGSNNIIEGNYIGINPVGNRQENGNGIKIKANSTNNRIGGTTAASRNVISGNRIYGIEAITAITAGNNLIQGNYIGTNAAGNAPILNGIGIFINSNNNRIESNVISGNTLEGVQFEGSNNRIQGNYIGRNATNTANIGNQYGIVLRVFSRTTTNNLIGGTGPSEGNVIAGNSINGIKLFPGILDIFPNKHNRIRGNSIFQNGSLGITIEGQPSALLNDPRDADAGANDRQNYPVLVSAVSSNTSTTAVGTLNSAPSQSFTLDFYSSAACDSEGNGEGETYLGSTNITTDAGGIAGFTANLPVATALGRTITATATDSNGNTSEFSRCSSAVTAVFSILGRITDSAGSAASNVIVKLSGANQQRTTDRRGNYSFSNVPAGGNYTVQPIAIGVTFSPPSRTYSNLSASQSDQNFIATGQGRIVGRITRGATSLIAISEITVLLSGPVSRSVKSDNNGFFVFSDLLPGSFSVTPISSNFTFTPSSATASSTNREFLGFVGSTNPPLFGRVVYNSSGDLRVKNPDTSGDLPLSKVSNAPSISRDGSLIAFSAIGCPGVERFCATQVFRVYKMNFDGSNKTLLSYEEADSNYPETVFSPDKTNILVSRRNYRQTNQVFKLLNAATGNLIRNVYAAPSGSSISDVSWSADGQKIAFARKDSSVSQIFTVNIDGSNLVQLTTISNGVSNSKPIFSPDGTKIAFLRQITTVKGKAFTMNADGTAETDLGNNFVITELAWSPDNLRIAYNRENVTPGTATEYGVMDANGTNAFTFSGVRPRLSWGETYVAQTPVGSNITTTAGSVRITFADVSTAGETTILPIPPASVGTPPDGFVIGNIAYEITTTANASSPFTICFNVPEYRFLPQRSFDALKILHRENGVLVDRTISRDFATTTICARTQSLSPFALAAQIIPDSPAISGVVVDASDNPLSGVEMNLTGMESLTTQTDSNGVFNFVNLTAGGNYNVSPKQVGYLFTEYNQDFVNLTGEQTVVFEGVAADFAIGGRITDAAGNDLSDVSVEIDGAEQSSTVTDSAGIYVFDGLAADGFYTVSPFNGVNNFSPAAAVISPLTSDALAVDFTVQLGPTAPLVDFGLRTVGSTTLRTQVLSNITGNAALQVGSLTAPTAPYSHTGGTCPSPPFTLPTGASCTLIYAFAPTAVGSFSQTLVVGLMVGSNPSSATFDLSGQAVLPNPESIFVDGFEDL